MVSSISGSGKKKIHDQDYYMDGYLYDNFDLAKDMVHNDWDMVCLYDGPVGSGKSVLAMQNAYFFDPSFNLDRVCFTAEEFKNAVNKAEKFQAVLFDEAYTGMSSRDTMKSVNKELEKRITEVRQKNLYLFIVMPTFFDLAKHMAIWRSRFLIHVYTKDRKRGFFAFYNEEKKSLLYIKGEKYYSYYDPRPNFRGRFSNHYVLSELRYRNKKYKSLSDSLEDPKEKKVVSEVSVRKAMRQEYVSRLARMKDLTGLQKARVMGIAHDTWRGYAMRYNKRLKEEINES